MRKSLIVLGFLSAGAAAWACGDKLMLVMGAKGALIRPGHAASILAYPGQNASASVIRGLQAQPVLKKAGHKFQMVEDAAGLDSALKAGKYDVVVADVASAGEISRHLASAPSKPVLLPVAFKASKEEQSAAQKQYHCLLKAPSDIDNYLAAIDQAMDWKLKTAKQTH
jgi:ABC-type amino acid transport substrate-binding protein